MNLMPDDLYPDENDTEPVYTVGDVAWRLRKNRSGVHAKIKRLKLGTIIDGRLYLSERDIAELKKPSPLVRANQDDEQRIAVLVAEMKRRPKVWVQLLAHMTNQVCDVIASGPAPKATE